ncbi:DUF2202 domain-containing protein [Phytohabitans rumicis]|uniref:Glyceraldehyde 3-phosphate dehydrogenase catalytic domain-containing protein n=1 Tax=Phytohabitans rumicis TaxID=1076125 RepID=A0A6V8LQW0_9ACTN|nr:DUF2202 domain-containing protein [Phytohabitans rumicis]GFJ96676.1 hypothetical protein Prum_103180 [Phytohabitans rumicis]
MRTRDAAAGHLKAGAQRVLISAPGKDVDATIVLGVNGAAYHPRQQVLSAAACTTNCAASMVKVLHEAFGLTRGFLTTVHAYTNDQAVLDTPHKDPRRARSAAVNIIPTSTGAAKAIGLVLPEVAGRLDGVALRVPVEDGSICDLTCELAVPVTAAEVNDAFAAAADRDLAGVLRYSERPLVSRDVVGDPASCVFDSGLTQAAVLAAGVVGAGAVSVLAPAWAGPGPAGPAAATASMPGYGMHGGANGMGMRGGDSAGMGWGGGTCLWATDVPSGTLTGAQRTTLAAMAEEEKLAHDLYQAFGGRYDADVFDRIAAAETRHLAAVRTLLDRYGIADPTAGKGGRAVRQRRRAGHLRQVPRRRQRLPARGARCRGEGRELVYQRLLMASQHHLAAFTR